MSTSIDDFYQPETNLPKLQTHVCAYIIQKGRLVFLKKSYLKPIDKTRYFYLIKSLYILAESSFNIFSLWKAVGLS